jgi:hypothetical protein
MDAGIFIPLTIISSSSSADFFPGGTFVYKFMTKDYFASYGTLRDIASDLLLALSVEENDTAVHEWQPKVDDILYDDLLYTIFMDDATLVPGAKTRYASGILLPETNDLLSLAGDAVGGAMSVTVKLLSMNERIATAAAEHVIKNGDDGATLSKHVQYQIGSLPKKQVNEVAIATHRFTGGVWSALLQTYKIIPKLKSYYQEYSSTSSSDGEEEEENEERRNLIVITKCSIPQKICTYYVPLNNVTLFYMNHITTEEYVNEFSSSHDDGGMLTRMGSVLGNIFHQLKKTVLGNDDKGGEESSSLLTSNGSTSEL